MKDLYEKVYALFDKTTPLEDTDCGLACNSACCSGDEDEGMYLYPGEMAMYKGDEDWISIEKSEFTIDGIPVPIAICAGKCDRKKRPLACRIFPLVFYAKRGAKEIDVIMDPRARAMCPLARVLKIEDLNPHFYIAAIQAADLLSQSPAVMDFIYEQSEMIDELPDLSEFDMDKILDSITWDEIENAEGGSDE